MDSISSGWSTAGTPGPISAARQRQVLDRKLIVTPEKLKGYRFLTLNNFYRTGSMNETSLPPERRDDHGEQKSWKKSGMEKSLWKPRKNSSGRSTKTWGSPRWITHRKKPHATSGKWCSAAVKKRCHANKDLPSLEDENNVLGPGPAGEQFDPLIDALCLDAVYDHLAKTGEW